MRIKLKGDQRQPRQQKKTDVGSAHKVNHQLTATTYSGLEEVLARELIEAGADEVMPGRRAVSFTGNREMIYRANFSLRTALKVLMAIKTFRIAGADDLYRQASLIPWEDYFEVGKTFAVQSTVFSDIFINTMYASLKVKDAIADRFRKAVGRRPSVDARSPEVVVNLHIADDMCTISLDSSGYSLHKRGYRVAAHEAPISEIMAAGLLKLSQWNGAQALTDPMCGSGTIAIEAAMIAKNILPGEIGRKYAFQHWKDYRPGLLAKIRAENNRIKPGFDIYGSDKLRMNIDRSWRNAEKAMVDDVIKFKVADFRFIPNEGTASFLLFNPPYGERINPEDPAFYAMIGERLKHNFSGSQAWILSTAECFKTLGLKHSKSIALFNGSIPCSFRMFDLFTGKRKEQEELS